MLVAQLRQALPGFRGPPARLVGALVRLGCPVVSLLSALFGWLGHDGRVPRRKVRGQRLTLCHKVASTLWHKVNAEEASWTTVSSLSTPLPCWARRPGRHGASLSPTRPGSR